MAETAQAPESGTTAVATHLLGAAELQAAGAEWHVERIFPFFNSLKVDGWIRHPSALPVLVAVIHRGQMVGGTAYRHEPEALPGGEVGFNLAALIAGEFSFADAALVFKFADGNAYRVGWDEAVARRAEQARQRAGGESTNPAHNRFLETLRTMESPAVLEIGARARSGVSRRSLFGGMDYLGMDIMEGDNVDVVGDAHELSTVVGRRRFDGVYSVSTFEHLLMPWKAALEINRVLRPGGLCFVHTHQTLGMHDMPWDFWRFSDTAWHALFNRYTGFEILETHLEEPMHIVPAVYTDHWKGYEGSLGFATSSVLARKTGETELRWDVPSAEVIVGLYPE